MLDEIPTGWKKTWATSREVVALNITLDVGPIIMVHLMPVGVTPGLFGNYLGQYLKERSGPHHFRIERRW